MTLMTSIEGDAKRITRRRGGPEAALPAAIIFPPAA
jgi:hypothetical protein